MLDFEVSFVAQCGYSGISIMMIFMSGSVLINTRLDVPVDKLMNTCPSYNKVQNLLADYTVNIMLLTQHIITNNSCIYIYTDKINKKRNINLVKYIHWYDTFDKKSKSFLLDVDFTNEDTEEIVHTLLNSL